MKRMLILLSVAIFITIGSGCSDKNDEFDMFLTRNNFTAKVIAVYNDTMHTPEVLLEGSDKSRTLKRFDKCGYFPIVGETVKISRSGSLWVKIEKID